MLDIVLLRYIENAPLISEPNQEGKLIRTFVRNRRVRVKLQYGGLKYLNSHALLLLLSTLYKNFYHKFLSDTNLFSIFDEVKQRLCYIVTPVSM